MGGDIQWGEYGDVGEICKGYDLIGTVKPLFAMQSYTGEAISLSNSAANTISTMPSKDRYT